MQKQFFRVAGFIIALIFGWNAYVAIVGTQTSLPAEARSLTTPTNPHILYLAPRGSIRGLANEDTLKSRGISIAYNWQSARLVAARQPLDALLIDATLLETITASDTTWLQTQFQDGVTLVGLGIDDDQFAMVLGLETFRSPAEANIPLGPTGYRLVMRLAIGTPEDLRTFEESNWVQRSMSGEGVENTNRRINYPLGATFSKARGQLDTAQDLDLLLFQVKSTIEGAYKMRAEWQERIKEK